MRLEKVLLGKSVRLLDVAGANSGNIYGAALTKALESRYGFLQAPRVIADYDLSKGVSFYHGYFQNAVIDRFQIFSDGVMVDAKADTDIGEAFIEDVMQWIGREAAAKVVEKVGAPPFFTSHLEVRSTVSLGQQLQRLNAFGKSIGNILRSYGAPTSDFELTGIAYSVSAGQPPSFKFERREGSSEQERLYFSSASLRTRDHMAVLLELESILIAEPNAS